MGLPKGKTNNPNGRPAGSKNEKTKQWEALGESIMSVHTEAFNRILTEKMEGDPDTFLDLYLKVLEYFKPKLARTETKTEISVKEKIRPSWFDEE